MIDAKLLKNIGIFKKSQAADLGFTPNDIAALISQGVLQKLDRGFITTEILICLQTL